MPYFAKLTTIGLQRLAEATATYTPLVFFELAVGDGNGSPVTPTAGMTELVNETARVAVNTVDTVPEDPNIVRVEGLLPATTGGFTIREAGLFNEAGELLAIASFPDIYKTTIADDGVIFDAYIRILIAYENAADAIEITADPSVVMATRLYVDDEIDTLREYVDEQDEGARRYSDVIRLHEPWVFRGTFPITGAIADGTALGSSPIWVHQQVSADPTIDRLTSSFGGSLGAQLEMYPGNSNTDRNKVITSVPLGYMQATSRVTMEFSLALTEIGANNILVAVGLANGPTVSQANKVFITKSSAQTNWFASTHDANLGTESNDTGVPPVVNTVQRFRFVLTGAGTPDGLKVLFYINDVLVATNATKVEDVMGWGIHPAATFQCSAANTAIVYLGPVTCVIEDLA